MSDRTKATSEAANTVAAFPIIAMGHGDVEVGDATWEGLPALWFGNKGQGLGVERVRNNLAEDGESLVMFTFTNLEGLEAIEAAVARVRKSMEKDTDADGERAAFEAFAQANDFDTYRDDTDKYREYHRATTRWAWMAWKARAAIARSQGGV